MKRILRTNSAFIQYESRITLNMRRHHEPGERLFGESPSKKETISMIP